MLPTAYEDDLTADYTVISYPTKTYRVNFDLTPGGGMLNGLEAMKQAVFLILSIERYRYEMFSWNYGVELAEKMGQPNTPLLQVQLKKAITEALMQDDRILAVDGFSFARTNKHQLVVSFRVETTQGEVTSALTWWGKDWEVTV